MTIEVHILHEAGYPYALEGVRLNFDAKKNRMPDVCRALAKQDRGHDKFLRMMMVWIQIRASRCFYQEMDTYQIGVVKNSQSTMHTLLKKPLTQSDFSRAIPEEWLVELNHVIKSGDLYKAKELLPEGFLQTRIYMMSYAALKNIVIQRHNHPLKDWRDFVKQLRFQLEHTEFIPEFNSHD